jgi:hypothetical protein
MIDLTGGLRIWKHSHGTTQTSRWSDEEREEFKADSILTIGAGLDRLQKNHFRQMRRGDFFYLCHGNDIKLLGQVASDILDPRARCLRRKCITVRRLEPGPWTFKGHRKRWSPGGNTTSWPVPEAEHGAFQKDILKPFFGLTLRDLKRWHKGAEKGFSPEAGELPPPIGAARPYKGPGSGHPDLGNAGQTVRSFDPDSTGRRRVTHDLLLYRFSRLIGQGFELRKHDYDLAVFAPDKVLLVEAKTLKGDAEHQLRLALGQLLYYHHRYEKEHFPRHRVFRLVLTDAVPPTYMVEFLEKYNVGAVWLVDGKRGGSRLGSTYLREFGHALNASREG